MYHEHYIDQDITTNCLTWLHSVLFDNTGISKHLLSHIFVFIYIFSILLHDAFFPNIERHIFGWTFLIYHIQQSVLSVLLDAFSPDYPFAYLQTVNTNLYYAILVENIANLLNQGFLLVKLKSSLRNLYVRHHDLVDRYGIAVSQMITDMFHLLQKLLGPFLIHDLSQSCLFFIDIRILITPLESLNSSCDNNMVL